MRAQIDYHLVTQRYQSRKLISSLSDLAVAGAAELTIS